MTTDQYLQIELARVQQQNRQLQAENAVLSAHVRTLVTYEADAKHAQRLAEIDAQPCYRCNHNTAGKPGDGCECCANFHTPNVDGNFPEPDPED